MPRKGGVPENLKPFKKGKDPRRNMYGAPALPRLKEALEKVLREEKNGIVALDAVLKSLKEKAIKGDVRAIQEILDRYYGKVNQSMELTGKDGSALIPKITIEVINSREQVKKEG